MRRNPTDKRQPERLAGSFLASLFLHVLVALLLFSVATSSSEQAAPESTVGNEIVSVTTQRLVRAAAAPAPQPAPPVPHAPLIAAPRAPQQRAAASHPRILHELSVFKPTAPPNPTPAPIASAAPNPQPTAAVITTTPMPYAPAAPVSVPTAAAVAVTIKIPPTAAPKPVATAVPSAEPTAKPAPSAAPTRSPATPAPARATTAPAPKPAPIAAKLPAPKPSPGVPSPGPTSLPSPSAQHGANQSPGPKPIGSPGPKGLSPVKARAPARAVQVPSTPAPAPRAAARPKPSRKRYPDINARLRGLIPTGPVTISSGSYHGSLSRLNGNLDPTPPPEIVAQTKFVFEETGKRAGFEGRIKMYVTAVHRAGPLTTCTGWVLRYPRSPGQYGSPSDRQIATGRVDPSGSDFGTPRTDYTVHPIVEANVTFACSARDLQPFAPSAPP
jgi:hypothetical protein